MVKSLVFLSLFFSGLNLHANQCQLTFKNLQLYPISTLPLRVVDFPVDKVKVTGEINPDFVANLKIIKATSRLSQISKDTGDAVFYPMGGVDLTAPLTLFPNKTTYVLLDNHGAIDVRLKDALDKGIQLHSADPNGRWIRWDEFDHNMIDGLLISLFSVIPQAKLLNLQFIRHWKEPQWSAYIEFLDTRVMKVKKVYFLSTYVDEFHGLSPGSRLPWWAELYNQIQPRNLLLKGSMSKFRRTFYKSIPEEARDFFLRPIYERGGVVVEGASKAPEENDTPLALKLPARRIRWELTDGDPHFVNPVIRHDIEVEFSYSGRVQVLKFDRPNEASEPQ